MKLLEVLPNFLIIGAARCGTTNFASYLRVQKGVFLAEKRPEPHYFLKDWEYEKGIGYYSNRYFHKVRNKTAIGEASASYICHRKVAERIHRSLPGIRLIAMLRNPIARAYSGYWHTVRNGYESLPFLEALKAEPARAAACSDPVTATIRTFAYIERGMYARQLRTFLDYFPREDLHIILFEDFAADPKGTTCAALEFLGLDSSQYREPTPADMDVNHSTPQGRPMDEASFDFLRAAYRDEIRELSELLGRNLTGWLTMAADSVPRPAVA